MTLKNSLQEKLFNWFVLRSNNSAACVGSLLDCWG